MAAHVLVDVYSLRITNIIIMFTIIHEAAIVAAVIACFVLHFLFRLIDCVFLLLF